MIGSGAVVMLLFISKNLCLLHLGILLLNKMFRIQNSRCFGVVSRFECEYVCFLSLYFYFNLSLMLKLEL